jgi:predicted amidohydrolase YtcJ
MKSQRYRWIVNCRLHDRPENNLYHIEIKKGKISYIQRSIKSKNNHGPKNYNANGRLVLPAFIDCHCHLFVLAKKYQEVDLSGSKSIHELQERIRNFVPSTSKYGGFESWIFGRGWDQEKFEEKRYPTRHDIDSAVNRFPAIMTRVCGHIAVANTSALEFFKERGNLSKFDSDLVPKDSFGQPTGIIKERALSSCWSEIPKPSISQLEKQFMKAQREALRFGLYSVHCILNDVDQLSAIQRLDKRGKIRLKLNLLLPIDTLSQVEKMNSDERKKFLRGLHYQVLGFKIFTDGSLGARTAALSKDYADDPGNMGMLNYPDEKLIEYARRVKDLGLIAATHAIGDRAVEQTLRCYARAGIKKTDGFRVEHASIVRLDLLRSLSGAILSVQPMFSTSDFWITERIGRDRSARLAYPFKTLRDYTLIVGGSDSPVESLDPVSGIRAAIRNRTDESESLSVDESLELYTKNAAVLSPLTKNSGVIGKGKNCDVVVVKSATLRDIETLSVHQLFIDGIAIHRTTD